MLTRVPLSVPAVSLRDDVKQYLPELLPNFTKLFEEAERTGRHVSTTETSASTNIEWTRCAALYAGVSTGTPTNWGVDVA